VLPTGRSDARRDAATAAARLKERDQLIARLRLRLKLIAECNRSGNKCWLCAQCLHLAWDED
jgi:hypothetical protein